MTTKEITIAKNIFTVSQPYAAGHVITDAEAKALNQVRAENIRNNMAGKVAVAFGDAPTEDVNPNTIANLVAEYDAAYVFTLASVGGGRKPTDPIEAEANKLAKVILGEALRKKGVTLKVMVDRVGQEAVDAKLAQIAAQDDVRKQAKKNVEARSKQAEGILDDIDLGEGEPAAE